MMSDLNWSIFFWFQMYCKYSAVSHNMVAFASDKKSLAPIWANHDLLWDPELAWKQHVNKPIKDYHDTIKSYHVENHIVNNIYCFLCHGKLR